MDFILSYVLQFSDIFKFSFPWQGTLCLTSLPASMSSICKILSRDVRDLCCEEKKIKLQILHSVNDFISSSLSPLSLKHQIQVASPCCGNTDLKLLWLLAVSIDCTAHLVVLWRTNKKMQNGSVLLCFSCCVHLLIFPLYHTVGVTQSVPMRYIHNRVHSQQLNGSGHHFPQK